MNHQIIILTPTIINIYGEIFSVIGTIISTEDSPNTNRFKFVVKKEVKKNSYVKINNIIGFVDELESSNPYYQSADSVAYYEKEQPLSKIYPTEQSEFLVASCQIFGELEGGRLQRISQPPKPGQNVELADPKSISKVLGLKENGLWLGDLEAHDMEIEIDSNKLLKKHLAILAISGAGKSYFVSVILEELMKKNLMLPIVLVDVHGEYVSLFEELPDGIQKKINIISDVKIGFKNVGPSTLVQWLPLSRTQTRDITTELYKIEKEVKGAYDIDDVIERVEKSDARTATKNSLTKWLSYLKHYGIFGKVDSITVDELVRPNQLSIINLKEIDNNTIKQIIVSHFANLMFNKRKNNKIPPFVLIVEEAHNFANQSSKDKNISKHVLETIAREGRKFEASLTVISQRPVQLDTTILSQCNTHAILRVTNPNDIKHIQESSEGFTNQIAKDLPGLCVGEVFLTGEAVNKPLLFKVRRRKLRTVKEDKTMDEMLKEWGDGVEKEKTNKIEAFI